MKRVYTYSVSCTHFAFLLSAFYISQPLRCFFLIPFKASIFRFLCWFHEIFGDFQLRRLPYDLLQRPSILSKTFGLPYLTLDCLSILDI